MYSLVYLWDSWQWEQGLPLVLWLALVNLFLMLDCLAQPEYRGWCLVFSSLMCNALLMPVGGMPLSKQNYRGGMG